MLDDRLTVLRSVQRDAQRGHRYVSDQDQYGVPEHWAISLKGDCEDYALWCREQLKKHRIASDLVVCYTETGEAHLVCSVDGWILDNRHTAVKRRDDLNYRWVGIGTPDGTWYLIEEDV